MCYTACFKLCFHIQGVYGGGSQKKTSGTLHLFNVTLEDDGMYICVTHNHLLNLSKRSKPAELTVQGECIFYILSLDNSYFVSDQSNRSESRMNTIITENVHFLSD